MANKYDIFISYRRDDGQQYARLIEKELKSRGYNVFLDYEELDKGLFDEKIVGAIASAKIFLMVLTPLYLSRCSKEEDWVRKEIQLAIAQKKEFVPVVPDGLFKEIPADQQEGLPVDIRDVVNRIQRTEVFMGQMMKPSFDYLCKHRIRPFVRPKIMIKTWMTIVLGVALIAMVGSYLYINYMNERSEQHRQKVMHQLEDKYASWGLYFNEDNDTISISQMQTIKDILTNMQDVIQDSLKMGIFEVTVGQWNSIMQLPYEPGDSLMPKTNVSWGDCMVFADRLYELTHIEFGLPTEEEWEYAARGGDRPDNTIYSGSNNPDEVAWYKNTSGGVAHECDGGNTRENGCGLYNMSGNVAEYCSDNFDKEATEGKALAKKVIKGGHYASPAEDVTIASRASIDENDRSNNKVGCRLVIRLNDFIYSSNNKQ